MAAEDSLRISCTYAVDGLHKDRVGLFNVI
jgi:hypothetical protein